MEENIEIVAGALSCLYAASEEFLEKVEKLNVTYKDIYKATGTSVLHAIYDPVINKNKLAGVGISGTRCERAMELLTSAMNGQKTTTKHIDIPEPDDKNKPTKETEVKLSEVEQSAKSKLESLCQDFQKEVKKLMGEVQDADITLAFGFRTGNYVRSILLGKGCPQILDYLASKME